MLLVEIIIEKGGKSEGEEKESGEGIGREIVIICVFGYLDFFYMKRLEF